MVVSRKTRLFMKIVPYKAFLIKENESEPRVRFDQSNSASLKILNVFSVLFNLTGAEIAICKLKAFENTCKL